MEPREPALRIQVALPETGATAYVVVDTVVRGLAGGGLRFSPAVTLEEVARLARTMTHKWASLGLPFGGAKLGVCADPNDPAKPEMVQELGEVLRPLLNSYLFTGPDMGTTSEDLRPLYRAAGTNTVVRVSEVMGTDAEVGRKAFRDLGGPDYEATITGWGVAASTAEACAVLDVPLKGSTVAVQGFGSVGASAAKYLHEQGARIVAIADAEGTVLSEEGLDLPALWAARDATGLVSRRVVRDRYDIRPRERWLDADADILIPAAIPDAITRDDVNRLRARLIVEAANIPIPEDVERLLHQRGLPYVPDFIANSGLACGFGIVITGEVAPEEMAVYGEVATRIRAATREVLEESLQSGENPREVAVAYAESRVARAHHGA